MTRLIIPLIIVLVVGGPAWGASLNGACIGTALTSGFAGKPGGTVIETTDKYRFENGSVFHRFKGREEYRYGPVSQVKGANQWSSSHLRFISRNPQSGCVIHGDAIGWKVTNPDCSLTHK